MSTENRLTKEQVLRELALDLSLFGVELYERGHVAASEALANMALDVDELAQQKHHQQLEVLQSKGKLRPYSNP